MNLLKFLKGLKEENLPLDLIEDGSIYHCEDTGNTYLGKEIKNEDGTTASRELLRYSSAVGKTVISSIQEEEEAREVKGEIFNDYINNQAQGDYSHAEGTGTKASGNYSHAEGENSKAYGIGSHTEGYHTSALGDYSHSEGRAYSNSIKLTGEPNSIVYTISESPSIYRYRLGSILKYNDTYAAIIKIDEENSQIHLTNTLNSSESFNETRVDSYLDGYALGDNSHAEGMSTTFKADSHAEGYHTSAIGLGAHSEGGESAAIGDYSHAEGENTASYGRNSHTEGEETIANGRSSHAEGEGTIANKACQHVQGKYNIQSSSYAHIVGNGSYDYDSDTITRSNAHTLDWEGNAWFAGDIKIGGTNYDEGFSVPYAVNSITIPAGRMYGDLNGDGFIDEEDLTLYMDVYTNSSNYEGTEALALSDLDKSGGLGRNDTTILKGIIENSKYGASGNDYTDNWKANPNYTTETAQFYTDINLSSLKTSQDVVVAIASSDIDASIFIKGEVMEGILRIWVKRPPIANVECLVTVINDGDGKCSITGGDSSIYVNHAIAELSSDSIIEQNKKKEIKFWVGTQEELDAIEDRDDNCLYFTTGEGEEGSESEGGNNPAYEKVENKTNIINESSTETQYPSAKAVYNAISNINIPYMYSTEDLIAGESPLAEGMLYFVYE